MKEAEKLVEELTSSGESAKNILGNVVSRKNDVDKLHKEIYGEDINDADGKATHVDGIKDELESAYENIQNSIEELGVDAAKAVEDVVLKHEILLSERKEIYENLLKEARARYEQINTQITGLLPGAMAEGLSAAYEKKREAEEISLLRFESKFSYAIYGLVAISMIPFAVYFCWHSKGGIWFRWLKKLPVWSLQFYQYIFLFYGWLIPWGRKRIFQND